MGLVGTQQAPGAVAPVLLDLLRRFLHNRAMLRAHRRWTVIACFAAWALWPAIGIGLAAHELEHHGAEPQDHSHAAQAAEAFLHGHVHEDDADDHVHDLAPPSFTPSRLAKQLQSQQAAVAPACSPARPASLFHADGPPPEPNALAPPDFHRLCVLRL